MKIALHTGAKFAAMCLALIAVVFTVELWQMVFWIVLCFLLAYLAGVFGDLIKRLLPFIYIVLLMLLIHSLVNPQNLTYWWYFGLEGLEYATRIGMRLIGIVLLANLMLLTTSSHELINYIGRLHPDLGIIFGLMLSGLPVIRNQMQTTLDVQAARGLDYHDRLLGRIAAYIAVIVPVIIQSINRAYYMAQLLYLRGYTGQRKVLEERWNGLDWLLFFSSSLLLIIAIYWRFAHC